MFTNSKKINSRKIKFILQAGLASFGAYFCMYAFRKPFTVATFNELVFWSIDYKILLIVAQVLGYLLSKFLGIKLISELDSRKRGRYLISLILIAELSLFFFAITPAPYNILFLFINGLPLGMVWGVVFSYLEGRRFTEILGVILCTSFTLASGFVKTVGKYLMDSWQVPEFWMPFSTGLLFIAPLILCVYFLEKLPQPTKKEQKLYSKRIPLNKKQRIKIFKKFALPITSIVFFFTLLTAFRDIRDNFTRELWDALGYHENASIYTLTEIPITIGILLILGAVGLIKNNLRSFLTYHFLIFLGAISMGLSTWLFQIHLLSPTLWMVVLGFGLFLCYIPFNCLFFDKMIATFEIKGNSGFLIYISDAFGYLGSMLVLLYKNFGQPDISWLNFFIYGAYIMSFVGILAMIISSSLFLKSYSKKNIQSIKYSLS